MSDKTLKFVSGSLSYRERLALPPDAEVIVELAYSPAEDEAPVVIGLETFTSGGKQVPFDFSVPYDEAEIDGRRNYFLQARIEHESGRYRFTSHEPVYVITRDHPSGGVKIMLYQQPVETRSDSITGTVTYRERIALAPDSVLTVRLQDISRQDIPAHVLGEQIYTTEGRQVPLPFEVPYNPHHIDERFTYSISARIEDGDGILRFISDTSNPVITRGSPTEDVEVWVRRL
jgi:putative lipoprotein